MRTLNLGDLKARIPIVQGGMGSAYRFLVWLRP